MDHYVLFIFNDFSADQEHLFLNYFKGFLPKENTSYKINSSQLLNPASYLKVINLNPQIEKLAEWTELNSIDDISKLFSSAIQVEGGNLVNENFILDTNIIADCIHDLSDQLPQCGSFTLDVLITSQVLGILDVSNNIEFAASLHRLTKWHFARTFFLADEKTDHTKFEEWLELTNADFIENLELKQDDSVLWRGSLEFKHPNISTQLCNGFELRYSDESKKLLSFMTYDVADSNKSFFKHLSLYPVLHAVDMCSFSSIPQHFFSSINFKLYNFSNKVYSTSHEFFKSFSKENEAALILRMGYSILKEKPKPDKSLNSVKWQKMVLSGNIKYPENSYPEVDKYITIAVTKSSNINFLIAHLLLEPSFLNAQFFFSAVNIWNSQFPCLNDQKEKETNFDLSIPCLSDSSLHSYLFKAQNSVAVGNSNDSDNERDFQDFNCHLASLMTSIDSYKDAVIHFNESAINVTYEAIDPSDWPERVHLLHKQIQNEEEKKNKCNVFLSFSPRRSLYNVSFSGDDIKKYFQPSGEAKSVNRAEPLRSVGTKNYENIENIYELKEKKWPGVLNYTYADIYYNLNNQSEEIEKLGSEMVQCYVPYETASTCNNHQSHPDAPISVHAKYLTPRKKTKSSKLETSFRQDIMKPKSKVKEKLLKTATVQSNPVISNIIKTLGVKKSPKESNTNKINPKRLPRKNSLPVRCSPRKKAAVCYNLNSRRFSNANSQGSKANIVKEKSPNDLPETSKKKLRVAVASALESNQINIDHELFRPCFKKLFQICLPFVQDIPREGRQSQHMQKIADALVQQVIRLEKQKIAVK